MMEDFTVSGQHMGAPTCMLQGPFSDPQRYTILDLAGVLSRV